MVAELPSLFSVIPCHELRLLLQPGRKPDLEKWEKSHFPSQNLSSYSSSSPTPVMTRQVPDPRDSPLTFRTTALLRTIFQFRCSCLAVTGKLVETCQFLQKWRFLQKIVSEHRMQYHEGEGPDPTHMDTCSTQQVVQPYTFGLAVALIPGLGKNRKNGKKCVFP